MAETRTPEERIRVDYQCEECGQGVMRFRGISHPANPRQYLHSCSVCRHEFLLDKEYPRYEWQDSPALAAWKKDKRNRA